jgi:NitT/TauT family transport system substrate-binding protein
MADALQALSAIEQDVPVTAIAATFQKNPAVIIAHPGVNALADLKGKPVAVSAAANTTFWPWLKQKYGSLTIRSVPTPSACSHSWSMRIYRSRAS